MINLEQVLTEHSIPFELYHHRAIYTNEDALVIKAEQGFTGTETKSLYLKDKKGKHYIYFTFTTKQSDFKKIGQLIGKRLSVVQSHQMEELTGQKAGAVSPFGYEEETPIIIDAELLQQEKLVFAPGRPDQTMVLPVEQLMPVLEILQVPSVIFETEAE